MLYRGGYKYQLAASERFQTGIPAVCNTKFMVMDGMGGLDVLAGYAWDGPSGITLDTASFMRGSLCHDALYQLMREGVIDVSWRARADQLLREICLQSGMWPARAWWVYHAVRRHGEASALPKNARPVLYAP